MKLSTETQKKKSTKPKDDSLKRSMKSISLMGLLGGSVVWVSNFSLGHDLAVCEFEPHVGLCADSSEPAWDFVSPSLSLPLPTCAHSCTLSLSLSKKIINIKKFLIKCIF